MSTTLDVGTGLGAGSPCWPCCGFFSTNTATAGGYPNYVHFKNPNKIRDLHPVSNTRTTPHKKLLDTFALGSAIKTFGCV